MKTAEEWMEESIFMMAKWTPESKCELIKAIQSDALQEAAMVVQKRREDYDDEHGSTEPETGAREYPKGGDEYVAEMEEIEEAILALAAQLTKEGKVESLHDALRPDDFNNKD